MRRSTGRLYAFCALVFALAFGASAYLNYVQYNREQTTKLTAQQSVTELRHQLGLDVKASVPPSPSPASDAPAIVGAKVVKINELGVNITTWNPMSDLSYQYQQVSGQDVANLTTATLIKSTTTCGPGALGKIIRLSSDDSKNKIASKYLIKQLGGYSYYYMPATTVCAKDPVTVAAIKSDNAVMPGVLATITPQ